MLPNLNPLLGKADWGIYCIRSLQTQPKDKGSCEPHFKYESESIYRYKLEASMKYKSLFVPGTIHVGYMVAKVAWGQVFHKFSPVKIVPLWPFIFIYHLGV
jgi:hypothetical protein